MDLPLRMIFDGIDRDLRRRQRNARDDHSDSAFECDRLNRKEMVSMRKTISENATRAAALYQAKQDLEEALVEKEMLLDYWMRKADAQSCALERCAEKAVGPAEGKQLADVLVKEEIDRYNNLPRERIDAWKKSANDSIVQRWKAEAAARRKAKRAAAQGAAR